MIYGIFGRPRAGKSYEAVRYHIIEAIKKGRMVVTNIPVNVEYIRLIYGEDTAKLVSVVKTEFGDYGAIRPFSIPTDFTCHKWKNEEGQGPLFVIDECHLCMGRDAKKELLEYMSLHGHYGHDIILLTQNPRKINRDIKDMVEISWRCIKTSVYGDEDGYIRKTYHGVSTSNADFLDQEERKYDPAFFRFYKSHTQSSKDVNEAESGVTMERVKNKKLIIGLFVLGFLILGNAVFGFFDSEESIPDETTETASQKKEWPKPTDPKFINEKSSVVDKPTTQAYAARPVDASSSINEKIKTKLKVSSKEFHPFYKVKLHISGNMQFGREHTTHLVASQNGQHIFETSDIELRRAGYTVEIYSDCSMKIKYFDYEDFLTCDAPAISIEPDASSPVTEAAEVVAVN